MATQAEIKLTAESAADALREVLKARLEAAGLVVFVNERSLTVKRTAEDTYKDHIADVWVGVGKRDYIHTVVEVTVDSAQRVLRKVTYSAGVNDGWTFTAEKITKVVDRVSATVEALNAKNKAEADNKAWRKAEDARRLEASAPIRAAIERHLIPTSYTSEGAYLSEWTTHLPVVEKDHMTLSTFTAKLSGLTRDQMVAVLEAISRI